MAKMSRTRRIKEEIVLGSRRLNKGDLLRVTITDFQGQNYIHAREWYFDDDGELCPGKGLCIAKANLRWTWKRLRAADRRLRRRTL